MPGPRDPHRRASALSLACFLATSALGFEFAPVRRLPRPADEYSPLDVFVGLAAGTDSNVGRSRTAYEQGDTAAELLAGFSFARRGAQGSLDLTAETRVERYADLGELDFQESILAGNISWGRSKFTAGLGARRASLADPVQAETATLGLLERTESGFAPRIGLDMGAPALTLGYGLTSVEYADAAYSYLDHEDGTLDLGLEFRTRAGTRRLFAALSLTSHDYDLSVLRRDIDRARIYGGWRSESPRRSNFEACLGAYMVDGQAVVDENGLFVRVRTTLLMGQGHSALELGYQRDAEPAATADFKTATRILARYSRETNKHVRWSVEYRAELSDYENPDATTGDSLSLHAVDAGLERRLGSPGHWRGRSFITVEIELGGAHSARDDFDRLRLLAGVAVAR